LCLLVEIAMRVIGIVTVAKGRIALSRTRLVEGPPAYVIGVLLLLTLTIPSGSTRRSGLGRPARGERLPGRPTQVGGRLLSSCVDCDSVAAPGSLRDDAAVGSPPRRTPLGVIHADPPDIAPLANVGLVVGRAR
jgi:hypothetical protein